MVLDKKLAGILSNFCLDIAKGFFAATFIIPGFSGVSNWLEFLLVLTKGIVVVMITVWLSWQFAKLQDKL